MILKRRARATVLWLVVALGACSSASNLVGPSEPTNVTVAIGQRPAPLSDPDATVPSPPTTVAPVDASIPIGAIAGGNQLVIIGDEVAWSASARGRGNGCRQLVPQGWAVEFATEPGRAVSFAHQVMADPRHRPGQVDVVVVMLGHRVIGSLDQFESELAQFVIKHADLPVILVTLAGTSSEADLDAVNAAIRQVGNDYSNAVVVDWAALVDDQGWLDDGGPRLTRSGSTALITSLAEVLGEAPIDSEGVCVDEIFVDDSEIVL